MLQTVKRQLTKIGLLPHDHSMGKAEDYLRHLEPVDALDKAAARLLEDKNALKVLAKKMEKEIKKGDGQVEVVDRGGRQAWIKRVRSGRWPKFEILGDNGNWYPLEDPLWAYAMYRLRMDQEPAL